MRVLLTRPNSTVWKSPIPLGLLYIASIIRKDNDVRIFDARLERSSEDELRRILREYCPDVVGMSLLTVEAGTGHRDAKIIKEELPNSTIICGGTYPSTNSEMLMRDGNFDIAVIGEGEESMPEVLERLKERSSLVGIQGIAYRNNGEVCCGEERIPPVDLDRIPFPAYDLIDVERYFKRTSGYTQNMMQVKRRALPILTSRGCPYRCSYCHEIFRKKFRARSTENIMEEIRFLRNRYSVEELHIPDDVFNIDIERAKKVCNEIEKEGDFLLAFPNGLRADRTDEELIEKMKRAGTFRIIYAIESGSKDVQRRIKKHLNLDKAMWSIEKTVEAGINTGGFFMLGFPEETREEMMMSIDFACSSPLHTASFFYVTPFPRTEIYEYAMKKGVTNSDISELYIQHQMDYNKPAINLSSVSDKELIRMKKTAIRKFYSSPRRWLETLRTMPNWFQIIRNSLIVMKLAVRNSVNF